MPYPEKLLAEDEEIVRHLHPHWLTIFWPVVWFLAVVGAASFGAALIPTGQQQGLLRLLVVAVDLPDGSTLEGVAEAVDWDGRLVVVTAQGRAELATGDVRHVRTGSAEA